MTNARQDTLYRRVDREKMPVPATGIFDSPYYIKVVNADWYKHISGIVAGLYENSAWAGTDDEIKRAIDEIHAFLAKDWDVLENCQDVYDCLSDDSPIMQSAYARQFESDTVTINQTTNNMLTNFSAVNEDIRAYNPAIGNSWLGTDTQANRARLCTGISSWLRVIQQDTILRGNTELQEIFFVTSAASIIAAGTTAGIGLPIALAVASGIAGLVSSEISAIVDAFNNQSALDEYACCLENALSKSALSEQGYISALSDATGCATIPQAIKIGQFMQDATFGYANTQGYLWLVDTIALYKNRYTPPVSDDCTCIDLGDCSTGTVQAYPSIGYFDESVVVKDKEAFRVDAARYVLYSGSTGMVYFDLPELLCVESIQFTRIHRNPLNTTGNWNWTIADENGETLKTQADNAGGTATITIPVISAGNFYKTRSLQLYASTTGCSGWERELYNFRVIARY